MLHKLEQTTKTQNTDTNEVQYKKIKLKISACVESTFSDRNLFLFFFFFNFFGSTDRNLFCLNIDSEFMIIHKEQCLSWTAVCLTGVPNLTFLRTHDFASYHCLPCGKEGPWLSSSLLVTDLVHFSWTLLQLINYFKFKYLKDIKILCLILNGSFCFM